MSHENTKIDCVDTLKSLFSAAWYFVNEFDEEKIFEVLLKIFLNSVYSDSMN
jgi:hypothetical protein